MTELNETHAVDLQCWVESANQPDQDFPIQNLPFAVFRRKGSEEAFRGGVAIGDQILDLARVNQQGLLAHTVTDAVAACSEPKLNRFMAMGSQAWSALRLELSRGLRTASASQSALQDCLVAMADAEFDVPCVIGDYTDFYTSVHHATNVGKLFRPDNPLLPNYKWIPIGYHGRSSSIGVSGQQVIRPQGQTRAPDAEVPSFGPCKRLDYELEVGIYIGTGNEMGQPIALDDADEHVFGYGLFNDWSARDIQAWEYQPLGPFLAKSFASTISPWIVTSEALAPFRCAWTRDESDPQPMPYLESARNRAQGALDIRLQVALQTRAMRDAAIQPKQLAESTYAWSYWTTGQMVAHHSVNGCNLQPGDFFGSGTQSGSGADELGSLLELTQGGKQAIDLPGGERRTFLEDGDRVVMRGYCERDGAVRIGFGEAVADVVG
jgi:fumarylacetoacetase